MSKKPYGKRYTRREFRNILATKPGYLAFMNENEAREIFLSPSEAQKLMNIEAARVAAARAMGSVKKVAKGKNAPPPGGSTVGVVSLPSPGGSVMATTPGVSSATTWKCPRCTFENNLSDMFCVFCGTPNGGGGAAGNLRPPAPPPHRLAPPAPVINLRPPAPPPHRLAPPAPVINLRPAGANPRATYATEQEKANLRQILTQRVVGSYAVVTQRTMTNGDCLYSSIYRAAFEQGFNCVIESILANYNGPMPGNIRAGIGGSISEEEIRFVQAARYLVSDEVRDDIGDFYDRMVGLFENDKPNYNTIIGPDSALDREVIVLIKRYIEVARNHDMRIANKVSFIRDYKNNTINLVGGNIPPRRIYSGEFENIAITRLIQMLCGINIISITSELRTHEIKVQPNTIYIENQGGGHYEYFQIGEPLPDRDPTPDEIIARSRLYIPIEIINSILSEYRGNLNGIINKIIEVYGGMPRGINIRVNTNYSNEYRRLRNVRIRGGTRRWRKTK